MKVFLDSIGCRLNQSEIESYARQFRSAGHILVEHAGEADLVVVNTCAVTSEAAADSRQKIRHAARAGAGEVVVTGCWSTIDPSAASQLPAVRTVVHNAGKDRLVQQVLGFSEADIDLEPIERKALPGVHGRTRAFIKVQDGCDNHCTFCVTRIARGAGRSRTVEQVLQDIQAAESGGAQEVVLTGVHLGSWGQDFFRPSTLQALIRAVLSGSGIPRLRLSSLEPWDLDAAFFELWQDQRLCRHLHLPLQSGSSATLRRMGRNTTPVEFQALVQAARMVMPDVAITTDLIAGFPGETELEFGESVQFVERMSFAGGHVFTYSPRPGTPAARLPGQIPKMVRKERNARLRETFQRGEQEYHRKFLGAAADVLWETAEPAGAGNWLLSGLTGNYLRVYAYSQDKRWNQIDRVRLGRPLAAGVAGEILAEPAG